jgi:hypothetical protein
VENKKWDYPVEDAYGIGISKTSNIVGEILVAVVVWGKKIRLYERQTWSSPFAFAFCELPEDEDYVELQKFKRFSLGRTEKCRGDLYPIARIEIPIEMRSSSYNKLEASLLENLVVIQGREPITDWMALCQKVTAEQFEEAMKEFEAEWSVFSFEDWGK